ncbi:two-component regulator propeller domain-containing protein [Treponema zioleckii]|uniref:two-component regulator propeller domain-containing protein n=1 Tax=Treponema zioleckii TaxID=331680 RepID=UPI00168BC22F|nr:two-component regulator propeller domain-containing protein [Treponema zioleckii]
MKKIIPIIISFLLFSAVHLAAEADSYSFDDFLSEYVIRGWTTEDGLPANTATDVIQDDTGYIYIGTYGGMIRFDGVDFTIYNKSFDSKYAFASARAIFQASDGAIWVGSNDEGLFRLVMDSDEEVKSFQVATGLSNNSVRAIAEDKQGNIWVATAGGLSCINKEMQFFTPDSAFQNSHSDLKGICSSLFCDTYGRMWVTTGVGGGLYYFENGKFTKYEFEDDSLKNNIVTCVEQDKSGTLWFGVAPHYAVKETGSTSKTLDLSGGEKGGTSVLSILEDSHGVTWFATDMGLSIYKDGRITQYTEKHGLPDNSINKIIEDREGNIWLATDKTGIQKLNKGLFKTFNLDSTVNAIAEGKDKRIWLGCNNGVVCYRTEGPNNSIVPEENEITEFCKGARIRHVGIAPNGDILVSAYSKLGQMRFSPEGELKNQWLKADGLTGEKVRVALEATRTHDVYIGTTNGLNIVDGETGEIRTFTKEKGFPHEYIMWIFEDPSDGKIWLGTDGGGVIVLDGETIVNHYTTENGLVGNIIFKITKDASGAFWICTGTGISKIQNGKITNFTRESGLGTDGIFQVIDDREGNSWLVSNAGVSSIQTANFDTKNGEEAAQLSPKFYSRIDGLKTRGTTSTSLSLCDSQGLIWITLVDGFAVCDPKKMHGTSAKPVIHIENITIDDKRIFPTSEKIIIPAGARRISIKYTGLSFTSPESLRFKYKLEGFDSEYSDWVDLRVASFTSLKPGKYTFCIKVTNGEGIESEENRMLNFEQKAFFYQKLPFWIAVGILIFLIILSLTSTITSFIKQLKILKDAVAELSSGNADLTKRVTMKKRSHFRIFDELVQEENRFIEKFQAIIGKVKESEKNLNTVGNDMGNTTQKATDAITHIISNISNVHSSIGEQNMNVQEAAEAVNEIAMNIDSLEKMIREQSSGVQSASSAVEEMVNNIRSVNTVVDDMANSFTTLEEQAKAGQEKQLAVNQKITQIEEKSKTLQEANQAIANIASQTNMLATNAAIEAAHAGRAGRGFAVVADEIQKLSETSSNHAKTIGVQLKSIQSSIAEMVRVTQESSAAFTAVSSEIDKTNFLVQQIKSSMEEQNEGSKQVIDTLSYMKKSSSYVTTAAQKMSEENKTILENMSGLKESSSAMQASMDDMARGAQRISESGTELSDMSGRMKDSIADIREQMIQFTV